MVDLNVSLLIQLLNFVFLIWAMNMIVYKPIRNILSQRKNKILSLEESIDASKNDVIEKDEAFSKAIKDARGEGLKQKGEILEIAANEEKKIISAINDKAQANLASIKKKIAEDAEIVKASLQKEVDSFADGICQKILGRAV